MARGDRAARDVPQRDAVQDTQVCVIESGFDQISLLRRAEVYRDNDIGWPQQLQALERYVHQAL